MWRFQYIIVITYIIDLNAESGGKKIKINTHCEQVMYGYVWFCFQTLFIEHLLRYTGVRRFCDTQQSDGSALKRIGFCFELDSSRLSRLSTNDYQAKTAESLAAVR